MARLALPNSWENDKSKYNIKQIKYSIKFNPSINYVFRNPISGSLNLSIMESVWQFAENGTYENGLTLREAKRCLNS